MKDSTRNMYNISTVNNIVIIKSIVAIVRNVERASLLRVFILIAATSKIFSVLSRLSYFLSLLHSFLCDRVYVTIYIHGVYNTPYITVVRIALNWRKSKEHFLGHAQSITSSGYVPVVSFHTIVVLNKKYIYPSFVGARSSRGVEISIIFPSI